MRRSLITTIGIIFGLIGLTVSVHGQQTIQTDPDYSILWNRFDHLVAVDDFVIGFSARGAIVAKYDADQRRFTGVAKYALSVSPQQVKLFDHTAVIKESDNALTFVNLSSLPNLSLAGSVELNEDFSDFCLISGDLIVSRWFDGITRYRLSNFSTAAFSDSSLKGVLVTQLEVENDTLYVLDEYNGIMRYDLAPSRMQFIDYLWVPHRPSSFLKSGDLFTISIVNSGLMFGQFGVPGSIVDSLLDLPPARSLYHTDRTIVQVNDRSLDLISKADLSVSDTITIQSVSTEGSIVHAGGRALLALPSNTGGFMMFDIEGGARPKQGFDRPGPISAMTLYGDRLIVGGEHNPIDLYGVAGGEAPRYDTTINEQLNIISDFVRTSDSLIVFYSHEINAIAFYTDIGDLTYPFFLESYYNSDTLGFSSTFLSNYVPHDSVRFYLIQKENFLDAYALMEYGELRYIARWPYTGRIQSYTVQGRYLFTATNKGNLWVHHIADDYKRSLVKSLTVSRNSTGMVIRNGKLWIFSNRQVTLYDVTDPEDPLFEWNIELPMAVIDYQFLGDSLYTTGYEGTAVYNLNEDEPKLVWSRQWSGRTIAADYNVIAISDGSAVDLFVHPSIEKTEPTPIAQLPRLFVLKPNYPNPFNASTTIQFEMITSGPVELAVYNSLGQKVRSLLNGPVTAGNHQVNWDGRNEQGGEVASGVYLYRLRMYDESESLKMILLK